VAELIGSLDVEERARAKDNRRKGVESSAANTYVLPYVKSTYHDHCSICLVYGFI